MPLLFRLIVAIAVSLAASGAAGKTYYNAAGACQPSVPCGDNVDVHYPFFLASANMAIDAADGYTAYSYCGYPGMAIACDGGRATLNLMGNNYTVLGIDYDKHAVTVADADVLDGGECPLVTHNVSVPVETWLNLSTTANINLCFFFGCVFNESIPPSPAPINCSSSSFVSRPSYSYVAAQNDVPPQQQWSRACEKMVVVPVLNNRLLSSEYLPRLNSDGYGKALKQGFQLTWDPSRGPCFMCEQSRGRCSYKQSGEFVGCLCSDGRVRGQGCGSPKSKKKITAYIVSAVTGAVLLSLLLSVCALYHKKFHGGTSRKGGSKHAPSIESFLEKHEAQHPKRYT